jgi:diguanylate cyclase (GGDEF)-like protein
MVDIDHFKSVNDNHGHPVGDIVLQQVSSILRGGLRASDVICRYGGEEFTLLLPETGVLDALQTAERIRHIVSDTSINGLQVTVSLGISGLEFQSGLPSEMLKQADQALYHAKHSGRNQTVIYFEALTTFPDEKGSEGQNINTWEPQVEQPIAHHVVEA